MASSPPCGVQDKETSQMVLVYTFIVTDMESAPYQIIWFYYGRSKMKNFINEGNDGFDFTAVSSRTKPINANRLHLHVLA